jgi:hypothetical protein
LLALKYPYQQKKPGVVRFLTRQGASNQFFGFLLPFHGKEIAPSELQKPTSYA